MAEYYPHNMEAKRFGILIWRGHLAGLYHLRNPAKLLDCVVYEGTSAVFMNGKLYEFVMGNFAGFARAVSGSFIAFNM